MTPTTIQTFSGVAFDLLNPRPEDVRLADIAHALARLNRYTGHQVPEHYSVAEHSVEVARRCPKGMEWAGLMHDAHEAYVGDLSSPLKRAIGRVIGPDADCALGMLEDRIVGAVYEHCGLREWVSPPPTSLALASPVWDQVKAADRAMLGIERDQIMAKVDWSWIEVPTTWHSVLECDSPRMAEHRFLCYCVRFAPTDALKDEAIAALDALDALMERLAREENDE